MPARPQSSAERARPLDAQALGLNSAASVLAALFASAVGASELGALVSAAIAPALITLVTHPGPHRRRRIALVVLLVAFVQLCDQALAQVRGRAVRSRLRGWGRNLRRAELTAGVAFAVAVVALTAPELVLGDAFVADRRLTLFDVDSVRAEASEPPEPTRTATPTPTPSPTATPDRDERTRPTPPPGVREPAPPALDPQDPPPDRTPPRLELPGTVQIPATGRSGADVRYETAARDAVDGSVTPSCRPPSGSRFPIGTTIVACTARDRAGNVASGSFEVRVDAPQVPTPTPTPPTPTPTPDPEPPAPEPEAPELDAAPEAPAPPKRQLLRPDRMRKTGYLAASASNSSKGAAGSTGM